MAIAAGDSPPGAPPSERSDRFTALYLRESTKQPVMPFKSLILAPAGPRARSLTLRSTTAEYSVRLKEPIEEQDDFIWLPYEVLGRRPIVQPSPEPQTDSAKSARRYAVSPSHGLTMDTQTDWLALAPEWRAGSAG